MTQLDTLLYDLSIPAISSLQGQLSEQADYMQLISVVFDPKYAFLIYAPLVYLFDKKVGQKLILTTVIAEWVNMILKWLLHGERPYWYVHSSGNFDPQKTPVRQFPITCELGPGHPSGHAMVTAAVWYIILDSLLQAYRSYKNSHQTLTRTSHGSQATKRDVQEDSAAALVMAPDVLPSERQVEVSTWSAYALILITVSVSRVFLGCHFPHQCLAGAFLGLTLARWVSRLDISASLFIKATPLLFAAAFGTYYTLLALGFDPSWTIKLATTHCVKREYIHLDTAPFFSIMRYCGFALGTGLGLMFPLKLYLPFDAASKALLKPPMLGEETKSPLSSTNLTWLSFKIVMALMAARLVDNLGLFVSHAYLPTYYASAFFAYTLFPFLFTNL